MVTCRCLKMSVMDITKMFSILRPKEGEEAAEESRELHLAVTMDNVENLACLLSQDKYKKLVNSQSGWGVPVSPLRLAASKGSLECLKILLANGAEVDILDVKAQTPLFTAVSSGHLDCVRELLKAGACPSGSIYNNCTPVLNAAREGNVSILRELLDYGAEPNVKCKLPDWSTNIATATGPLYLSAVYGHLECFRTLLLYGADPDYNCTDEKLLKRIKSPKTVLDVCLKHGCKTPFVKLLIDFGANVYLPDIHISKSFPNHEAMELLARERVHPKSLMSQCRLTILNLVRQGGKMQHLHQLEIPHTMIKYLLHKT
ncbi:ankyrin repeat and SOCS box protein 12-like [Hyla sarda]|uniref:ankyrin repeat and SOCS box protein 12-like n=1 Tax=Hyla sarda TaxID=327740 RepID=UPI0024C24ADC|nr:ankyrin repeat and SOCS box protein 12-like [Hyla sarda]XP_056397498.1 ankyrin repeat and SOCS box protein 12-like [Hyla sarda]XP_056397499.1 ankyrin repeat and SOCS box protein 12-like [Hyla sarda]